MAERDGPMTPGAESTSGGGQWARQDGLPVVDLAPGIRARIVTGEQMMTCWITIEPDRELPLHDHPNEQIGVVVEGSIAVTIGEETRTVEAGEAYVVPAGVRHGGKTGPDGVLVMESFSPPRADYLVKALEASLDAALDPFD